MIKRTSYQFQYYSNKLKYSIQLIKTITVTVMDVQCFIWYLLIFIGILFQISLPWKQLFPSLIYEILIYGKNREGYSIKWSQLSVPRR